MPEQHHKLALVEQTAKDSGISAEALTGYMASGDVSKLQPGKQAELLVALARHVGASPLVKPWMIVDGKLYPSATCASAIRIMGGLECNVVEITTTKVADVPMIKAVAQCEDPKTGRTERATSYVPIQVEEVTEWGTTKNGKRYPKTKIWRGPTPDELADKIMKAETKADRRATLKFSAMGTSAAEDVPGKVRDWVEPVDEPEPVDADFTEREPGDDGDEPEPPHPDEAGA